MCSKIPSIANRAPSVAPICQLLSKAFPLQSSNHIMSRSKADSVNSCQSRASLCMSCCMHGKKSWKDVEFEKPKPHRRPDELDQEIETLAKELLPKILKMPFTVEQWRTAIHRVCDQFVLESPEDADSEQEYSERRRTSCPERPKLPMVGLSDMEKRLRDREGKLFPSDAPQQQSISICVPEPMNLPVIWVPKLPLQTTQILQDMPCELFRNIHRSCQQTPSRPPQKKSAAEKPPSEPKSKPKPKSKARKRTCSCGRRMPRQERECFRSAPAPMRAASPPPKPRSAPPAPKETFKAKPAPKPKSKPPPKPKAKPPKPSPAPKKANVEKPAVTVAKPSKSSSGSSSEESSESDTPAPAPTPAAPASPSPAGTKDYLSDLFADNPAGGGYSPSGAASPAPAAAAPAQADWMKDFGGMGGASGASSPRAASPGAADWLTGAAPAAAAPAAGSDWLSDSAPKSAAPGSDWLS